MVKVDVEYCGVCNFESQCKELSEIVKTMCEVDVTCKKGRRGAFEVSIDEKLVHSKLSTLAFPDYKNIAENVKNAQEGKPLTIVQEQPITDCVLM